MSLLLLLFYYGLHYAVKKTFNHPFVRLRYVVTHAGDKMEAVPADG